MDQADPTGGRPTLPLTPRGGDDLCVARVPIFQGLTLDQQRDVATLARPTRVEGGEQIYAAGEAVSQLMVVHTGRVKISRLSADGHEQIVRVLEPGDFVGEAAFLDGTRPDHFAVALEQGSMCVFRHSDLGRLVGAHPSVALSMLRTLSRRLEETETRLASVTSGDVAARLVDYLMSLPTRREDGVPVVQLPMAKKDIASLLDTTPESLSRQLRRLGDRGVIEQRPGRRIALTDLAALSSLSGQA